MDFKKGDFITWSNKPNSFAIYEGNPTSIGSSLQNYSLIVFYDPSKYVKLEDGTYGNKPVLEIGTPDKPCEKKCDTNRDNYWWTKCNTTQQKRAEEVLASFNLLWDNETSSLIDTSSGEIIRKIATPKNEYHGEVIKPIMKAFKEKLSKFVNPQTTTQNYNYPYNNWGYSENWDEYDYYD